MALKLVRSWRGVVRATIKDAKGDLQSLINYNTKHPSYNFLTPSQASDILLVISDLQILLDQKRLR